MDPILAEIYSTVLGSAPYVIVAYALLWFVLLAYVFIIMRGFKKSERELTVLEEALADTQAKQTTGGTN